MSNEQLILAIDQGTTSSRVVLVNSNGQFVDLAQEEITQIFPQSGWVNQDARHIWEVTLRVVRQVLDRLDGGIERIAAIGITNQRETTVLWNRTTGEPVAPAIVWQSRQTAEIIQDIERRGRAERYQAVTGLVPDAYFSASKIAWLLDRDVGLRARAEAGDICFGTIDSWLIWKLTNGRTHVTDVSNASRTMLYDIRKGEWSEELLADLHIPKAMLPEVCANSGEIAVSDPSVLGRPIPITGSAGDQQSALFGQACFRPGEAKNTYGTGSFLLMQTGTEAMTSNSRLLTTIAWEVDGETEYALEGSIFVTGSAVQWLRDGLGIIRQASEVEALALSVEDTGGVAFVPALSGLGAPHWDADARGTIVGISRGTTSAHIARATLEAIAMQSRDVLKAMESDAQIELAELRVDGGAAQNDLLMQMQADLLGVPVVRPRNIETTVLGAAYLAGLGARVWAGREDVRESWEVDRRFEPTIAESEREARIVLWQDAVDRAKSR
ncbi:MAG TPA: glycerol kinase GlpK [Thermomicrobiales bacterium]|nr:glycerol kinase GlpK [Thermomicrobiales bacterium]